MGHHTYDVLAAKIESVHEFFGFSGKISATITDNRSNFVKSSATFMLPAPDVSSVPDTAEFQDDTALEEEEVTSADVVESMGPDQRDTQDDLTQIEYNCRLPKDVRLTLSI